MTMSSSCMDSPHYHIKKMCADGKLSQLAIIMYSLVPRPLPLFQCYTQKREGLVSKVTCVMRCVESLIASGQVKGHLILDCSRSQQVSDKAKPMAKECTH